MESQWTICKLAVSAELGDKGQEDELVAPKGATEQGENPK